MPPVASNSPSRGEPAPRLRAEPGRVRRRRRRLAAARSTSRCRASRSAAWSRRRPRSPGMIDAYVAAGAASSRRRTSLVTGYDFLADAANAVRDRARRGTRRRARRPLITPNGDQSPQDPPSWTATQLRAKLLGSRARRHLPRRATSAPTARSPPTSRPAAHDRPRGVDRRPHQLDRVQRRLPRRLQHRRRRRDPGRDAAARLGAGVRAEEGDADRGHRLPVRRHRLPRVQRAALQQLRAAAARRHAARRSRSARRWCRRSSTTSRRRRTSAASTRRRCSRRRSSGCRCSA